MLRFRLFAVVLLVSVLSVCGAAQAARSSYPSQWTIAHAVKALANKTPQASHYTWRYSKVTCLPTADAGSFRCHGVGRWAFGFGSVMTAIDWNVTSTESGAFTATATWILNGQIGAQN